jgi:predicted nucleic acid-binding protein
MKKIFVDTAAWIALFNRRDALHHQTRQLMDEFRQQNIILVSTEFLLLEVADAFSNPAIRGLTVEYINRLRRWKNLQIIPVSQSLLAEGWQLYSQRSDKDWGLTDCISFVVMRQENITEAFTSDHHFQQAGFVKLL